MTAITAAAATATANKNSNSNKATAKATAAAPATASQQAFISIGWPLGTNVYDNKENNKVQPMKSMSRYEFERLATASNKTVRQTSPESCSAIKLTFVLHIWDHCFHIWDYCIHPSHMGLLYSQRAWWCSQLLSPTMTFNRSSHCHQCCQFHCCNYAIRALTKAIRLQRFSQG